MTAEDPVFRYMAGGNRKHRLRSAGARRAVCGMGPWAVWEWLGGQGTPAELEALGRLPECGSCVRESLR